MFCQNCGQQLPDNSTFCNICGARVGGGQMNTGGAPYAGNQGYNNSPGYNSEHLSFDGASRYTPAPSYNPGYQQPQVREHAPVYKEDSTPKEVPDGKHAGWLVFLWYVFSIGYSVMTEVLHVDENISTVYGAIFIILSIVCLAGDAKELKRCGYKISKIWFVIGFFWSTLYLFVRAKKTGTGMNYVILRIIYIPLAAIVLIAMAVMGGVI